MFLPIPVLVYKYCGSSSYQLHISAIRCKGMCENSSMLIPICVKVTCNLYCLQINEKNSLFQVFSWWDGAKRCVQEKQNKKKTESGWVRSLSPSSSLFSDLRTRTSTSTRINLKFTRMFQKGDCTPENFILLFVTKKIIYTEEGKAPS